MSLGLVLVLGLSACDGGPVEVPRNDAEPESLDPVVVRTAKLWDAVQGHEHTQSLLAEGGSGQFQWRLLEGTLPDGLSLAEATGEISGIAVEAGDWTFTVEASSGSAVPGTKELSMVV
ncbi:MAG TPA: Ig domain-containing protein, partial [Longimicrobiaceae bacterium]|nr:Ig domain-containing protein [Longimicrobiaceae bacterium]